MKFEDCKKIMLQYLNGDMTKQELVAWGEAHCMNCTERVCHCSECPMMIDGQCRFGE